MKEPIYFSKVEYRDTIGGCNTNSIILLNLVEKELSYQVYGWKRQMPAIQGKATVTWSNGVEETFETISSGKVIRDNKTGFKPVLLPSELEEEDVIFSYGISITDKQMKKLLPYCNALDFEPYRNKEMSRQDEGCIGYRDEIQVHFSAITDSYIPKIDLPMYYYYDEEHIWPSEKLYRYIIKTFFERNKELKERSIPYGGLSLLGL